MAGTPLSLFLITYNEEARLTQVLASLPPCITDIVVVDSGSTDNTCTIARKRGARVLHQEWLGYGGQKRFAEEQCKHDWVLNLDGDEVLSPALRDEIEALSKKGLDATHTQGYRVWINTVYPGDAAPRRWARDYNVVRLYNKKYGRYRNHPLHDRVVFTQKEPALGQLHAPIYHYNFESWAHLAKKGNLLSSAQIIYKKRKPKWLLKTRLITGMPVEFLKYYLLKRHVTGGWKGFAFALTWSFFRTLRFAKALHDTPPKSKK